MAERPVCLVIGALGGQGGGVLVDWLVEAAQHCGYPAQATSIPGVAQRTGATTYYFELYPERDLSLAPVFSLFPSADEVDLMAAMEPTEAGRALEKGWITDRSTVITTTERIYSTAEKSLAGDGRIDPLPVLDALARAARSLLLLESRTGGQINALMLGAIAGTGVLPIEAAELRGAIARKGLAVGANQQAFDAGLAMVQAPSATARQSESSRCDPPPPGFDTALAGLPAALREMAGHALARLVDYQDPAYASLYLDRLRDVIALDTGERGHRLSLEVTRRLAAWMSYEDVMRVAQLKTRPGRLQRIRAEIGARPGEPLLVHDYFKPRRQELGALLPAALGASWARGTATDEHPGAGLRLRWPTASPLGYGALKLLAGLRRWRRHGQGYAAEQRAIEAWLAAVASAARVDYDLALVTAELAVWARGYGAVRERGLRHLEDLWSDWQSLLQQPETLAARLRQSLEAARRDPDHPPAAAQT